MEIDDNSLIQYEEIMDGEWLVLNQFHGDENGELIAAMMMNRATAIELARVILEMFEDP